MCELILCGELHLGRKCIRMTLCSNLFIYFFLIKREACDCLGTECFISDMLLYTLLIYCEGSYTVTRMSLLKKNTQHTTKRVLLVCHPIKMTNQLTVTESKEILLLIMNTMLCSCQDTYYTICSSWITFHSFSTVHLFYTIKYNNYYSPIVWCHPEEEWFLVLLKVSSWCLGEGFFFLFWPLVCSRLP